MKRELAYVELTYLVKEWQVWIGARIAKIVVAGDVCSFELYKSGGLKTSLVFFPPLLWMGEYHVTSPLAALSFTLQLRKLLEGRIVRGISLVSGERLVLFDVGDFRVVFQLFGRGNMFVLDKGIVVAVLRQGGVGVKARIGEALVVEEKVDPRDCIPSSLSVENLLKIGLGKTYAQEALVVGVRALFEQKSEPCIVWNDGVVMDVTPFPLSVYKKFRCENYCSYNSAIDIAMQRGAQEVNEERIRQSFTAKLEKVRSSLASQELHLEVQKKEVIENQKYGELIYENYGKVKEVLDILRDVRKKLSWDEIKKKLAGHDFIKEVDEKKGKVVLELFHV